MSAHPIEGCGRGCAHAEWPMEAVVLLDGERYAEIRSVEDGERWVKGRAGGVWTVVAQPACQSELTVASET